MSVTGFNRKRREDAAKAVKEAAKNDRNNTSGNEKKGKGSK